MTQKSIALPILLFIFILSGCSSTNIEQTDDKTLTVPIVEISHLDTVVFNDYIANIQAIKNIEIRSRLKGFLDRIHVDEGSLVKKGQILFSINADEYLADVKQAEAVLNNVIADAKTASLDADRTKLLVDKNIISKTDLEFAMAKVNAAESRVAEARAILQNTKTRLAYTDIRSPFDGRIDRIPLKEGSLLEEGALLTSVSELSSVYAYFDITEQEYLRIMQDSTFLETRFKKQVNLTLANGEPYQYPGDAEFAESEFEANTGSISLRAKFPNPNGLLKHGSTGRINVPIETGETLVVPQKAVFEIQDRTYVYLLTDSNTVKMTPFHAGRRIGHYYHVLDGLKPQDKVVYEGSQNLKDGMTVNPNFQ